MGNWVQTHAGLCKSGNIRLSGRVHRTDHHFTLTELLVVLGIIIILVAMVMEAIPQSKFEARKVTCMNRRRQNYMDVKTYTKDHYDSLPGSIGHAVTDSEMLKCPSFVGTDTNKVAYHTDKNHFSALARYWDTVDPTDPNVEVGPFWLACPNYSTNEGGGNNVSHYYRGLNAVCYDGSVQWLTQSDVGGMHWDNPAPYHPRLRTRGGSPPFWNWSNGYWPDGKWKDGSQTKGYWVSGTLVTGHYIDENGEQVWETLGENEDPPDEQVRRINVGPDGTEAEGTVAAPESY